ncbi:MAG: ABC transporter substrate-binding protein [Pleomorphochaeta sp.]
MKKIFLLVSSLFILLSLNAQGTKEDLNKQIYSGKEGKITAYISGPANMLEALENAFEEDKGDVLDIVQMGCGPLRQRVWTEAQSGSINADVFWGSDPLLYEALSKQDVLEYYIPKGYDKLANRFQIDKPYTLVNERYGVVIYNSKKVVNEINSYYDLIDSVYKNQIVHADPTQSATALALIASLWNLEAPSGSYHKQLIENGLYLAKKNSDVPSKIQEGEFIIGIAPHDAVWRLKKSAKKKGYTTPLEICWPQEGAIAIQRPVAISKNSARFAINEELAKSFVDFLISPKAQNITKNFGFISVLKDAELPIGIPENIKVIDINWDVLAETQNEINNDFEELFK